MVKIPQEVYQIIHDYVKKISCQIPVKKAVLFGSYAKGTFEPDSDIDLAIFSEYFEQMDRAEGIYFLLLQAMDYGIDLEPIAFTEEEYKVPIGIVTEIIDTGIEISV